MCPTRGNLFFLSRCELAVWVAGVANRPGWLVATFVPTKPVHRVNHTTCIDVNHTACIIRDHGESGSGMLRNKRNNVRVDRGGVSMGHETTSEQHRTVRGDKQMWGWQLPCMWHSCIYPTTPRFTVRKPQVRPRCRPKKKRKHKGDAWNRW